MIIPVVLGASVGAALLFSRSRDDSGHGEGEGDKPGWNLDWTMLSEKQRLGFLTPDTQNFVMELLGWGKLNGMNPILGETYSTTERGREVYEKGLSAIEPGKLSWHNVGRGFHIILKTPKGQLDKDSYPALGAEVRKRGGTWLGDFPIRTKTGVIFDTAHFEFHPDFPANWRRTDAAKKAHAALDKKWKALEARMRPAKMVA